MIYLIRLYSTDENKKPYFWGIRGAWTYLPESFKYMGYFHAKILLLLMKLANKEMRISTITQTKMELVINLYRNPIKVKE